MPPKQPSQIAPITEQGSGPATQSSMAGRVDGWFDTCDSNGITGWVFKEGAPGKHLEVEVLADGHPVARAVADKFRGDLAQSGVGNGAHGFNIILPRTLFDDDEHVIEVREISSGFMLHGSPKVFRGQPLHDVGPDVQNGRRAITPKLVARYTEDMSGQRVEPNARDGDVRLIAYYLPQFHPIVENDEWWGPGFTEWTNVSQAVAYFKGHYQPRVPGELGYYDLRLPEVREAQARLAREHGIFGFCYYYYWFSGRRLLERPLQEVIESGKPDFPFCICWANENWSRRWDGSEDEILVQQVHSGETDEAFIRDVIPLFKDPRYIKLHGAPLLIIYRVSLLPDPRKTAETWRRICDEEGISRIHLCMAETFGLSEPRQYGFDSAVQFPPHNILVGVDNEKVPDLTDSFSGKIYDMHAVIRDQLAREAPTYQRFPGVMTAWDNTPRKKNAGNIFLNSSPDSYEVWLRGAIDYARERLPQGERLVFVNAWNEWAEGAHLEPDKKHGRGYLEATRRALTGQTDWQTVLDYAEKLTVLSGETKKTFLADVRSRLARLSIVNQHLIGMMGDRGYPKQWVSLKPGLPYWMEDVTETEGGESCIDRVNHNMSPGDSRIGVDSFQKLHLEGWAFCPGIKLEKNTPTYLMFRNVRKTSLRYHCLITERSGRDDVAGAFPEIGTKYTLHSGFKLMIDLSTVQPGPYRLSVAVRGTGRVILTHFETEIEIV